MAGLPGRLRLIFRTLLNGELSTWIPTAICFWAENGTPFYCVRSSNAQIGNQTPTFDRVTPVNMGGDLTQGGINGIGLCGQTFLAVDRSGGATNNNVYMLASVLPPGRSTTDVMFVRSTDGGQTFSAPHRINDDPNSSKQVALVWHIFSSAQWTA